MESIAELRKKVQVPVRRYNDVAGLLVGDRVSIHITRLFIALGLPPTLATVLMFLCGLAGSGLVVLGGVWAALGFGLLVLYYIFDCVDGEVARYRDGEKYLFGFIDFAIHLVVKSAFFVAVGVWSVRVSGEPWVFGFALAALLATLLQKLLHDAHVILVCRLILLRGREQRRRFLRELLAGAEPGFLEREVEVNGDADPYRPRGLLAFLRVAAINFDLGLIAYLIAAIADLSLAPFGLWGLTADLKLALTAFYGIVLPLDMTDRAIGYLRSGEFLARSRALMRVVHNFRCDDVLDERAGSAPRAEGEPSRRRARG
jgi:hypothetical protein